MTHPLMQSRPSPQPSSLTEGFWDAAARHVLVRPVCDECGHSFFTPQIACPSCLSEQWHYEPSSGRGRVYSATAVHRPPYPGALAPYQLAIVDLDEGWSMMSNVVDAGPDRVLIGAEVEVDWITAEDGTTMPAFRLRSADAGVGEPA